MVVVWFGLIVAVFTVLYLTITILSSKMVAAVVIVVAVSTVGEERILFCILN